MSILDRVYKAATVGNGTERWLATSTSSILRLLLAAGRTSGEFSRTVAKRVETSVHKHRIQVALLVVPFNLRPLPPPQISCGGSNGRRCES